MVQQQQQVGGIVWGFNFRGAAAAAAGGGIVWGFNFHGAAAAVGGGDSVGVQLPWCSSSKQGFRVFRVEGLRAPRAWQF